MQYTPRMGLLRPRPDSTPASFRPRIGIVVTCPYNGHQVGWCKGLCTPIAGIGHCGRPAGHALVGRTQLAIAAHLGLTLAPAE
jgi:hypothetical protein